MGCQNCDNEFGVGATSCDKQGITECDPAYLIKDVSLSKNLKQNICLEIFNSLNKCAPMHPSDEGKYGPVCTRCTSHSCLNR